MRSVVKKVLVSARKRVQVIIKKKIKQKSIPGKTVKHKRRKQTNPEERVSVDTVGRVLVDIKKEAVMNMQRKGQIKLACIEEGVQGDFIKREVVRNTHRRRMQIKLKDRVVNGMGKKAVRTMREMAKKMLRTTIRTAQSVTEKNMMMNITKKVAMNIMQREHTSIMARVLERYLETNTINLVRRNMRMQIMLSTAKMMLIIH